MKIDRESIKGPASAYGIKGAGLAPSTRGDATTPMAAQSDNVSVSVKSLQVNALREQLAASPEVRAELVARLKAEIESGTYLVDGEALAARLLRSRVLES